MKRLLTLAVLASATLALGACASQGSSYGGGGGGGYAYYFEDRYYDCYDQYNCGYYPWQGNNPAASPQRAEVVTGPARRPVPHVIERPVENGSPTGARNASRSFSHPHADVTVDSSSSSGGSSSGGSSGVSSSPPPPPPPAPAASFSPPVSRPDPIPVTRSPQ